MAVESQERGEDARDDDKKGKIMLNIPILFFRDDVTCAQTVYILFTEVSV